jgi:hypothetical protein
MKMVAASIMGEAIGPRPVFVKMPGRSGALAQGQRTSDAQLHIGESRNSGLVLRTIPE